MAMRAALTLALLLGAAGCLGEPEEICSDECNKALEGCGTALLSTCVDRCVSNLNSDDTRVVCHEVSSNCAEYQTCINFGVCPFVCGNAFEVCDEFTDCTSDCEQNWSSDTAQCVKEATACPDQFLCVTF